MPPDASSAQSRTEFKDSASIVIVREGRFKYRWTVQITSGGRRRAAGLAWTSRGARYGAMAQLHGFTGSFVGRVEREEIQVAARMSTSRMPEEPEMPPLELIDAR